MTSLAILGDFNPTSETHAATNAAIEHSKAALKIDTEAIWIPTDDISENGIKALNGILIAPGSPYKNMEKVLFAIKYARENKIPCLGTCGGFQHMILEYARNVLGHKLAHHAEYHPLADELFISQLSCSLKGREMELCLTPGSMAASLYGTTRATEKYYCSFGVNPEYVELLRSGPMQFVGSDKEGEIRILEYPGHPFFVGTLFVPQARSTKNNPHPIVMGFLKQSCSK